MKTNLLLLGLLYILFLASCSKEDQEENQLDACFEVDHAKSGEFQNTFTFTNCSENADRYEWDFGDGTSSTIASPTHVYGNFGNYTVRMTAYLEDESKSFEMIINYGRYVIDDFVLVDFKEGNLFSVYGNSNVNACYVMDGHLLAVKAKRIGTNQNMTLCARNYSESGVNCANWSENTIFIPTNTELIVETRVYCSDTTILGGYPEKHVMYYEGPKDLNLQENLDFSALKFVNAETGAELTASIKLFLNTTKL